MAEDTYESQYLALCQRSPGLRRECPYARHQWPADWQALDASALDPKSCRCGGTGWLPRPEPERLGALVEAAMRQGLGLWIVPVERGEMVWAEVKSPVDRGYGKGLHCCKAPQPWQALTAALTAAPAEAAR